MTTNKSPDQPTYREAGDDPIHARLKALVEVRTASYLWVPADAITFTPPLSNTIYGDGRALFTITTLNDRPAWWVIRGDSGWGCSDATRCAPDFHDFADDILTHLEEEFGTSRCSYSGNSLRWPAAERIENCQCEDCSDPEYIAEFPTVDGSGGCSWSRMRWPAGFSVIDHPWTWQGNLLALEEEAGFSPAHPPVAGEWERRDLIRAGRAA